MELLDDVVHFIFNFVGITHCFPKWMHPLHPHQQRTRVPVFPHSHQHFLLGFLSYLLIRVDTCTNLAIYKMLGLQ